MSSSGKSLKEKAYRELKEFLIIVLYLWIIFALLIQYKSVLAEYSIQFAYQGIAVVNARLG